MSDELQKKPMTEGDLKKAFEDRKHIDQGEEVWSARDLMELLGYSTWRNFHNVIKKAIENANNAGIDPDINFVEGSKISMLGFGGRDIKDYKVTRGGAYLIALNADAGLEPVAVAKRYFATQTHKMEVIQQKLIEFSERVQERRKLVDTEKELSQTLYERGVDGRGIGIIRSEGDKALFGGLNTAQMKEKLGLPAKGKPLADKLHTVAIKAKELTAAMTSHKAEENDLRGELPLKREHVNHNTNIRKALVDSGLVPEDLPPCEDTAPALRKLKKQESKTLSMGEDATKQR